MEYKVDNAIDYNDILSLQQVFKNIMDAFSRPLKPYSIQSVSDNGPHVYEDGVAIRDICCVFLDSTVSYYVHGDDKLSADIMEITYSNPAEIEKADFVIIKKVDGSIPWEKIKPGTLVNPHKGATVIVEIPQIHGDEIIVARGPGIDGQATCHVSPDIARCLIETSKLNIEYPMGYELIFVTPSGEVCAAGRRINISREGF